MPRGPLDEPSERILLLVVPVGPALSQLGGLSQLVLFLRRECDQLVTREPQQQGLLLSHPPVPLLLLRVLPVALARALHCTCKGQAPLGDRFSFRHNEKPQKPLFSCATAISNQPRLRMLEQFKLGMNRRV